MIRLSRILVALIAVCVTSFASASGAGVAQGSLQTKLTGILQTYVNERGEPEHITAASVSVVSSPKDAPVVAAVGAKPSSLFQIGSNTKAFTAVLALQLEAAGKLNLDAPIGTYLPQYPAWKNVTIRHMLNMTSGLPTYDNDPAWQRVYAENPYRDYSAADLVGAVYPKNGKPTFEKGWYYSNTGYILTQMILERVTGQSYAALLQSRIFKPFHLTDLYYDPNILPATLQGRLVSGYFFNDSPDNSGLQLLYKKNVRNYTLSWTQAAGGIVATPAALDRWVRVLYGPAILPKKQRDELFSVVSMETGKPVAGPSQSEPRTFGLGVGEMYKAGLGRFWFYEGMTLGYRVVHVYAPQRNLILTLGLNSQPNPSQDHVGQLMDRIMQVLPPG